MAEKQIICIMYLQIFQTIATEQTATYPDAPAPPVPEEERVTVRLKFLNETQKDVSASLVENVGQFKRRYFSEEMSSNKNVRLIFNGQVLRDENSSLRSCGIFDKCVVHCLIHQGPTQAPSSPGGHSLSHSPNTQPKTTAAPGKRRPLDRKRAKLHSVR